MSASVSRAAAASSTSAPRRDSAAVERPADDPQLAFAAVFAETAGAAGQTGGREGDGSRDGHGAHHHRHAETDPSAIALAAAASGVTPMPGATPASATRSAPPAGPAAQVVDGPLLVQVGEGHALTLDDSAASSSAHGSPATPDATGASTPTPPTAPESAPLPPTARESAPALPTARTSAPASVTSTLTLAAIGDTSSTGAPGAPTTARTPDAPGATLGAVADARLAVAGPGRRTPTVPAPPPDQTTGPTPGSSARALPEAVLPSIAMPGSPTVSALSPAPRAAVGAGGAGPRRVNVTAPVPAAADTPGAPGGASAGRTVAEAPSTDGANRTPTAAPLLATPPGATTPPAFHLHGTPALALAPAGGTTASPGSSSTPAASGGAAAQGPASSGFLGENAPLLGALSRPQAAGDGTYSLTANLHPPELGHVQAVVSVHGDEVQVALSAGSAAGHDALSSNLDQLRQQLASSGSNVVVTLARRDDGADGRDGSRRRSHDSGAAGAAPVAGDGQGASGADPLGAAGAARPSGTGDLYVIL